MKVELLETKIEAAFIQLLFDCFDIFSSIIKIEMLKEQKELLS
jgi:hypothetical protein